MSLTQRFVERERAVGGAGDAQVPNRAHGHERGKRLVIAQTSARLGVEMHRRAPPAREQKGVAIARSPAEADRFDASSPNDALDRDAPRHSQLGRGAGRARIEYLDLRTGLSQGLGDWVG